MHDWAQCFHSCENCETWLKVIHFFVIFKSIPGDCALGKGFLFYVLCFFEKKMLKNCCHVRKKWCEWLGDLNTMKLGLNGSSKSGGWQLVLNQWKGSNSFQWQQLKSADGILYMGPVVSYVPVSKKSNKWTLLRFNF